MFGEGCRYKASRGIPDGGGNGIRSRSRGPAGQTTGFHGAEKALFRHLSRHFGFPAVHVTQRKKL
jgi:hypothetical protein